MKISELIRELKAARKDYGDLNVQVRQEDGGRPTSLPASNASARRDGSIGIPYFLIDT